MIRSARNRPGDLLSAFGVGLFTTLAVGLSLAWSDVGSATTAAVALDIGVAVTVLVAGAAAVAIGTSIGLGAVYTSIARSEDSDPPVVAGLAVVAVLTPTLFGVAALAAAAGRRRRALLQRMRHAVSHTRHGGGAVL